VSAGTHALVGPLVKLGAVDAGAQQAGAQFVGQAVERHRHGTTEHVASGGVQGAPADQPLVHARVERPVTTLRLTPTSLPPGLVLVEVHPASRQIDAAPFECASFLTSHPLARHETEKESTRDRILSAVRERRFLLGKEKIPIARVVPLRHDFARDRIDGDQPERRDGKREHTPHVLGDLLPRRFRASRRNRRQDAASVIGGEGCDGHVLHDRQDVDPKLACDVRLVVLRDRLNLVRIAASKVSAGQQRRDVTERQALTGAVGRGGLGRRGQSAAAHGRDHPANVVQLVVGDAAGLIDRSLDDFGADARPRLLQGDNKLSGDDGTSLCVREQPRVRAVGSVALRLAERNLSVESAGALVFECRAGAGTSHAETSWQLGYVFGRGACGTRRRNNVRRP
jgi:hypothetical protein